MRVDWSPLKNALSEMRAHRMTLPIWWRDDDAVARTAAFDRLAELGQELGVPVHIAVIPDLVEASLPPLFDGEQALVPMVHGWRHQRHFLNGKKDTEFGIRRPDDGLETALALDRMREHFGNQLLPVFVPPWNMIADSLLPVLGQQGYIGVSTFAPRKTRLAADGLVQINTHLDPIDWRGTRGLVDPDALVALLVKYIRQRMEGQQDPDEPLGFLTHHLVHTEDVWAFTRLCLAHLLEGGATPVNLRDQKGDLP